MKNPLLKRVNSSIHKIIQLKTMGKMPVMVKKMLKISNSNNKLSNSD
jgi:hypothetical protein